MRLENGYMAIELADNTGAILQLEDTRAGAAFVDGMPQAAFRITALQNEKFVFLGAIGCTAQRLDSCHGSFRWELEDGSALKASIELKEDGVYFSSEVSAAQDSEIILAEYPVIGALSAWDEQMEMVHSFATGLLVHNPLKAFEKGQGIRYAPYPECFSGASMQFYAYYGQKKGGLYFAAEDQQAHLKWLNLYRNGDGMEATVMYANETQGKGKSFSAPWAFHVGLLGGGDWFSAAERYKQWAVSQPWCAMGRLEERKHSDWLLQKIGLTTFGIDAAFDRSEYIRLYHKDIGSGVFHILGPDWTKQDFMGHAPGAYSEWIETRFDRHNIEAIRACGDYFAPFEFDFMVHPKEKDAEQLHAARQIFPTDGRTYSCDAYHFNMLCPCEKYTHDLHVNRDLKVVEASGADAMYYDISANNLLHLCLSEQHHHPKVGGHQITEAYSRLYLETKEACAEQTKRYFPIGTEMINEVFLPAIDYYQARAGAQPASALEMWPYKELLNSGKAELVPLFAAVYHEYGAVRMDGWGKLVEETGDLFYDIVAKIYQWGGLYELNHEYSPMEALEGKETKASEHYWRFAPYGYEYSRGRARYLRQFAALRTGAGNAYLAYGIMQRAPKCTVPAEEKNYYHYNHGAGDIEKFSGRIAVPGVRINAWRSGRKEQPGYAVFLTNTTLKQQSVALRLDPAVCGRGKIRLLSGFDPEQKPEIREMGCLEAECADIELILPSREPVMLEIC